MAKPLMVEPLYQRVRVLESELITGLSSLNGQLAALSAGYEKSLKLVLSSIDSSATAELVSRLGVQVNDSLAQIAEVQTAFANLTSAFATTTETLTASVEGAEASIKKESTARASADEAMAADITQLQADFADSDVGALSAALDAEILVRASADEALALRSTALEASVDTPTTGLLARMTAEETTRASADEAIATDVLNLTSLVEDPITGLAATYAGLTTEISTRTSLTDSLATGLTNLEVAVNDPTTGLAQTRADLTTEQTTRASADTALAEDITNLSATVDGVQAEATVLTNAFVTGGVPNTNWGVELNAGGVITGIKATAVGGPAPISQVAILADAFKVQNSDGSITSTPFSIVGSDVFFTGNINHTGGYVELGSDELRTRIDDTGVTFGDTAQRHIEIKSFVAGQTVLRAMTGAGRRASFGSESVGGSVVGAIYADNWDGTSGVTIRGAVEFGAPNVTLGTGGYLSIAGNQVVGSRQAAIADLAPGADMTDVINKVNAILAALRTHGLIAT